MSERSTERLPPMDSHKDTSTSGGTNTSQGTETKPRGKDAELRPDKQPDFDAQEDERRKAVHGEAVEGDVAARLVVDPAELDASRTLARAHVDVLNDAMVDLAIAHGDWLLSNVLVYLGGTGGGGAVQFESVAVERLATTALRSAVQAGGRTVGGLIAATSAKPVAAAGGGFVMSRVGGIAAMLGGLTGVLISSLWGLVDAIFERHRINKLVHAATSNLTAAVKVAVAQGNAVREEKLGEWYSQRDGLRNAIDDARSLDELRLAQQALPVMIVSARKASEALKDDKSLAKELLTTWLKQTAKTDEEPGKDVNPVDHAKAQGALREAGVTVDFGDMLVEQCRYEWGKLGVDTTEALAALSEVRRVSYLPDGFARAVPRQFRFTRVAKPSTMMAYLAAEGHAPSPQVVRANTMKPARLLDEDPDKHETVSHERAATTGGRPAQLLNAVMFGKVDIVCKLGVGHSDKAAYVEAFDYDMTFLTDSGGQVFVKSKVEP